MNHRFYLCFALFVLFLTGCASGQKKMFIPVSNIPNNNALIYVYSDAGMIPPTIQLKEQVVGLADAYYYFFVEPGKHEIEARAIYPEDSKKIIVDVHPGEIIYVKAITSQRFGGHTDIRLSQVDNAVGQNEIQQCHMSKLASGTTQHVKGFASSDTSAGNAEYATVQLYRTTSNLLNSGIGSINIGIYSGKGSHMVGVGLNKCEGYKFKVKPGLVKCVVGSMAIVGGARLGMAMGAMMTGMPNTVPGEEFVRIETGLGDKNKSSWNFMAEAGKTYYLEYDPHKTFSFREPNELPSDCLSNEAAVIVKRDTQFSDDIKTNKKSVGIGWINSGKPPVESGQLYENVRHSRGLLDYITTEFLHGFNTGDLQRMLSREMLAPKIENLFLDNAKERFKKLEISPVIRQVPLNFTGLDLIENASNVFESEYVILMEVLHFGVATTHSEILPTGNTNRIQPVAFASVKGFVIDKKNQKVLFKKPFNGVEIMPVGWNHSPEFKVCKENLNRALESAINQFLKDIL